MGRDPTPLGNQTQFLPPPPAFSPSPLVQIRWVSEKVVINTTESQEQQSWGKACLGPILQTSKQRPKKVGDCPKITHDQQIQPSL